MGYYINTVSNTPFTITRPDDFVRLVHEWETRPSAPGEKYTQRHMSWCNDILSYEGGFASKTAHFLDNFGFLTKKLIDGTVAVDDWQGDKMGSTFDEMWDIIAKCVEVDAEIEWIWQGEDNTHWATRISNNVHTEHDVEVVYNIKG